MLVIDAAVRALLVVEPGEELPRELVHAEEHATRPRRQQRW
jgi:hypothetical protein